MSDFKDRPPAPRPTWRTVLATVTGNLFLVLGSLILGTLSILVSWVPPRGNWVFAISRIWSVLLLRASWLRVEVHREAGLDPKTSYVFLANHQSLFDIPLLLATVPGQVRMMAKRSLFLIPIFGWALSAGGFIPIDRGDRSTAKARQSFSSAMNRLRGGVSILLFPEGTRSLTDTLLPFQRGGFLLALKQGLPIVPVGIRGTRAVQPKGNWAIRPGTVTVCYGAPIQVTDYGIRRKGELNAEVRRRIAELADIELAEEAGGETAVLGSAVES
ncbi:MAG TPA: lysophospholipid acyltransferase family protein [Thermoanaerobaculia bacterium]|nr:lysophospholipid acyltransferase family protein [Thermoanaerobaculia bacterium]